MEQPSVENKLIERATGVTYLVMAYRPLTRAELLTAVAQQKASTSRPPRRGQVLRVHTLIGATD